MSDLVIRTVLGWDIATGDGGDDVPRVRDIDLAERLGYERPRNIRKLIERHLREGNLNDSDVRSTVEQTSERGGRPGTVHWLAEEAAYFITQESTAPNAILVRKEMCRVFIAFRRGVLQPAQETVPREIFDRVLALAEQLASGRERAPRPRAAPDRPQVAQAPVRGRTPHPQLLANIQQRVLTAAKLEPDCTAVRLRKLVATKTEYLKIAVDALLAEGRLERRTVHFRKHAFRVIEPAASAPTAVCPDGSTFLRS